jgi:biotin carboxyl carrier protein
MLAAVFLVGWWVSGDDDAARSLYVSPERGVFRVEVTTTGELQAKKSVQITGPTSARRARIYQMEVTKLVEEGTVVEKGDFVAQLDRSELASRMEDARLELQKAQSQYEQARLDTTLTLSEARDQIVDLRYAMEEAQLRKEQSQFEAPSVQRQAEIDYEKANRNYEQAKVNYRTKKKQAEAKMREVGADRAEAQKEMRDLQALGGEFRIVAPENGMVVYHRDWRGQKVTEGSTIRSWDPVVATLPDLSIMESITFVNEVDVQKVEKGQTVDIGLDADPDKKLTGVVTSVANIGQQRPNADAKVFEVVVEVNEADTTLRPAMTTSNAILVEELSDVVSVPLETLHAQGDSITYVFARAGTGARRQEVEVGLLNENRAVVNRGVTPDDELYLSVPPDTSGLALQRLPAQPGAPGTSDQLARSD